MVVHELLQRVELELKKLGETKQAYIRYLENISGLTMAQMQRCGLDVKPCHCGKHDCAGWKLEEV